MPNVSHMGMKNTSTQVMFRINTKWTLKKLRGHQNNTFKEKGINVCKKITKMEHANKIDFLVGPNAQFSNMEHYENMTKDTIKVNIDKFELIRKFVCEQGKKSKCIVTNAMLSSKERIDAALHEKN